ncbi:glycosyltransferase family 4 protein [Sulfurovum sp. AR]|uniref:glycosyltransferase family 4 protein n=1 Tax=Sulfurovum sp. AR TaxID=1165841 RepID=UPI00025C47BE|nr:glycosyltransferase family 4 protein [Sulfurovum sp. AR]EIF51222.1 glycosyltransferase [Sulfurovum sp. AR]
MKKYVVAFAGKRDLYQVPLALYEDNLLCKLKTNFYAPDKESIWYRFLPKYLKKGHIDGLPKKAVDSDIKSLVALALRKFFKLDHFTIDYYIVKSLSLGAARIAEKNDCDLFLYSGCGLWAFEKLPNKKKVLFQYHPHSEGIKGILEKDYNEFPEVLWSYQNEIDTSSNEDPRIKKLNSEWKLASHIICASSFTKQSLINVGCDENIISVVPYGFSKSTEQINIRSEKNEKCKFLFVGQGIQRKGLHHLIKAWELANTKNAELTLICTRIDPGIKKLITENTNIVLKNKVSTEELNNFYYQSDIFIMPSLVEGFGLVYLEAIEAGCYCIGSKNTGLPDLNLPESVADICSAGDIDSIEKTINNGFKKWENDELDRESIANHASHWTWNDFRKGITHVLNDLK